MPNSEKNIKAVIFDLWCTLLCAKEYEVSRTNIMLEVLEETSASEAATDEQEGGRFGDRSATATGAGRAARGAGGAAGATGTGAGSREYSTRLVHLEIQRRQRRADSWELRLSLCPPSNKGGRS